MENHHVAASFALMKKPGYDILQKLEKVDFKRSRKLMINAVLGTDMAKHI
jgi:hypothetical protein